MRYLEERLHRYTHRPIVVAAVTEREPEWSSADRQSLLAYLESRKVGSHGHPMSEATSPLADPSNVDREYEYYSPPPTKDFANDAIARNQAAYKKRFPDADLGSLLWRVEKRVL